MFFFTVCICHLQQTNRNIKETSCLVVREIDGDILKGFALKVLQKGENYLNDKGVFVGGDLEVLLEVYRELPNFMIPGQKGFLVPNYSTLCFNFIDTAYSQVINFPFFYLLLFNLITHPLLFPNITAK